MLVRLSGRNGWLTWTLRRMGCGWVACVHAVVLKIVRGAFPPLDGSRYSAPLLALVRDTSRLHADGSDQPTGRDGGRRTD
eukprot:COSAG01_NODE_1233_length_11110_cov_13.006902_15_plen_80_part_00